jgi:hypothetical protein
VYLQGFSGKDAAEKQHTLIYNATDYVQIRGNIYRIPSFKTAEIFIEERGLIEQASSGTYSRRIFSITPSGKKIFLQEINTMPAEETSRFQLLLFLKFGEHIEPKILADIIATHRESYTIQLKEYRKVARDYPNMPKYDKVTLDFGIHYTEMVLKWLDETESRLLKRHSSS